MSNFNECLQIILHHEGGYVNHPEDPGGATNLGVTKRVYEEWVGRTVSLDKMEQLQVSDVAPIYKKNYWDKVRGDDLPSGADWACFDWAVNSGSGRPAKALQRIVGATQDGAIGPKSLALIEKQDPKFMVEQFGKIRQEFYESLSTFKTFGRGWTRRNEETTQKAVSMVQ